MHGNNENDYTTLDINYALSFFTNMPTLNVNKTKVAGQHSNSI